LKTRLLIVDDHPIFRSGLKLTVSDLPDMVVAGEASSGEEALEEVERKQYDVVLLDISMPRMSGMQVLEQLRARHPELAVLVVSFHPEEEYAIRCLRGGAAGYLTKNGPPEELVEAVRKVARGGRYVSATLAEQLASQLSPGHVVPAHETLSDREKQVMLLMVKGVRLGDIAVELGLSPKTVSTYRSRIFVKLGIQSTAELVRYAVKEGLAE